MAVPTHGTARSSFRHRPNQSYDQAEDHFSHRPSEHPAAGKRESRIRHNCELAGAITNLDSGSLRDALYGRQLETTPESNFGPRAARIHRPVRQPFSGSGAHNTESVTLPSGRHTAPKTAWSVYASCRRSVTRERPLSRATITTSERASNEYVDCPLCEDPGFPRGS
jgi:hypothetical protein